MGEKKILVVDDEEAFCKPLAKALSQKGFSAVYATTVERALELIASEKPDLMTLDINMPGESPMRAMNGLKVLNEGKKLHPDMRIVMVSAVEMVKEEKSFLAMGAHAVHQKPVELATLLVTIRELLGE